MKDPSSRRYDVIVTITREGRWLPGPAEFAARAQQAASRNAVMGVMSAHTADKIIAVVKGR